MRSRETRRSRGAPLGWGHNILPILVREKVFRSMFLGDVQLTSLLDAVERDIENPDVVRLAAAANHISGGRFYVSGLRPATGGKRLPTLMAN